MCIYIYIYIYIYMNTQLGKGRRGKPVDSETTENWTQVANSTHRDPNPKDKSLIRKNISTSKGFQSTFVASFSY